MKVAAAFVAGLCLALGCGGSPSSPTPTGEPIAGGRLLMTFTPQDASFNGATEAYRQLWRDDGALIVGALERVTGLPFFQTRIDAIVFEGISTAGNQTTPMRLRASYNADTKRSALTHELGHRLIAQLTVRPPDLDEHRVLYLFLYEVWESIWGAAFADRQITVESNQRGNYDYESAWRWSRSQTAEQRAARFAAIMRSNGR
jgi:hypothetical protein